MKLPSANQVAAQVVVALVATIAAAWIVSRVPALRDYLGDGKGSGGCGCR